MRYIQRVLCFLLRRHRSPRLFATNLKTGEETYVCVSCHAVRKEYNLTGRH